MPGLRLISYLRSSPVRASICLAGKRLPPVHTSTPLGRLAACPRSGLGAEPKIVLGKRRNKSDSRALGVAIPGVAPGGVAARR
jgi:hypothetical protein